MQNFRKNPEIFDVFFRGPWEIPGRSLGYPGRPKKVMFKKSVFFFWISLVASLNLFLFVTFLYLKFLTFDWFLIEALFSYIISLSNLKSVFYIALGWFNFLFCIFLKCGVVPFYFWKPIFFKGTPLHALLFYIVFYYFSIVIFILHFLMMINNFKNTI